MTQQPHPREDRPRQTTLRLVRGDDATRAPFHAPWPSMPVSLWRILLRADDRGPRLTPTAAGVHSVVSSWLHRARAGDAGEPHGEEHNYAVCWRQVSDTILSIELRLLTPHLAPVLLGRVTPHTPVRLGRVRLRVIGIDEIGSLDLANLPDAPTKGWRLRFPDGITFKRGNVFMPWPDPYSVLGSIQRRLALSFGWPQGKERLPREVASAVVPIDVDLQTFRWPEGNTTRESTREVSVAVGEVRWVCTGSPRACAYADRLLRAGELVSAGAKTAWGTGVIEIVDRLPASPDGPR